MSSSLPNVFGPYLLLEVLGRGGKGTAYLAVPLDPKTSPSPVVVKILHPAAAKDESDRARFEHEAKLAVATNIDAIATVYDAGLAGGTAYIAMELVRGMSISRLLSAIAEHGAVLALEDVLDVAIAALSSLKQLHEARDERGRELETIHRDLSPSNLMLEAGVRVRILDLGIGRSRLRDTKTATGVIAGTPGYMSPEQVLSAPVSQRSDVYTIGAIFFELLTGKRYIARGELAAVLTATVKRVFEPPSSLRAGLSAAFDDVCRRALDLDPQRRFASAGEFLQAVQALRRAVRAPSNTGTVRLSAIYAPNPVNDEALAVFEKTRTEDQRPPVHDTVVIARREPPPPPPRPRTPLAAIGLGFIAIALAIVWLAKQAERQTVVIPYEPGARATELPAARPRALEAEAAQPIEAEVARPIEAANEPEPARKKAPRAPLDRASEAAPAVAQPQLSIEQLVARLHQEARAKKRDRPELAAAIDELLNAGLFEAAAGDTPAVRARLEEITAELERLKGRAP